MRYVYSTRRRPRERSQSPRVVVVSNIELTKGGTSSMPTWSKRIFIAMSKLSVDPVESYSLHQYRTPIVGMQIEV